jgi:hypothetical protein
MPLAVGIKEDKSSRIFTCESKAMTRRIDEGFDMVGAEEDELAHVTQMAGLRTPSRLAWEGRISFLVSKG